MSNIDIAVLAAYCGSFSDMVEAIDKQRGKTTVIKTHNGNWVQSPFVSMIRSARADMVRYAIELGMSPTARSSMDISIGGLDNTSDDKPKQAAAADRYF